MLQASFCAPGGRRRLERAIYPGTSKEHLKGMCSPGQSWCFPPYRMLVVFLRSFSCIQPSSALPRPCQILNTSYQDQQ